MKIKLLIITFFISTNLFAQQKFAGIWEGRISAGVDLRIVFHFSLDSSGTISATMDSPDQSAFGMKTDYTYTSNDSIYTGINQFKITFSGIILNDSTISGQFKQATTSIPLELKKVKKVSTTIRSQTPVEPFPYDTEEINYNSGSNVQLYGTLTSPKLDPSINYLKQPVFPAVILITGSGPQNRDEEILGHKPFAVIADYLTKKGFIVLRVDDRGTGKSTGNFESATSADFAADVNAGINFLKKRKEIDTSKIGLLGHSEGAMVAPIVAAKRKDIYFIILLAGPGIKNIDLMTEQNLKIYNSMGISKKTQDAYGPLYKKMSLSAIKNADSVTALKEAAIVFNTWLKGKDPLILKELNLQTPASQKAYIKNMTTGLQGPWFKYFLQYDPAPVLMKLTSKVLALNGDKDLQVIATSNLTGMETALKKSGTDYEIHSIPGVNHLFQTCKSCLVSEYGELDETISPKVLDLIGNWLTRKVY